MIRSATSSRRLRALRSIAVVLPAAGCALTLVAGWPGGISPDMATTIWEGLNFRFSGWFSPLFSLVWALPLAVMPLPAVIAMFFILQTCAYWLAFFLFGLGLIKSTLPVTALLAAFAGFLPPLFGFTVMIESNVQAGTAWILSIACAYAFPRRRTLWVALALVFYGYIVRHGMIAAVGPVLVACFLLANPDLPLGRAIRNSVAVAGSFAVISWAITAVLPGPPTTHKILGMSHLIDIARVYQGTGEHCIPASFVPETTTAEKIMAEYDPGLAGRMVWGNQHTFRLPHSKTAYDDLKACWLQTIRRYPREYLSVKAQYALIFLMVGVEWAPATRPDYSRNAQLNLSVPDHAISRASKQYVERSRTSLVWKGWFWLALNGLISALALKFKHPRSVAAVALLAAALGTLVPHFVAGNSALGRYYFLPFSLCVTELLILAGGFRREREVKAACSVPALKYPFWRRRVNNWGNALPAGLLKWSILDGSKTLGNSLNRIQKEG